MDFIIAKTLQMVMLVKEFLFLRKCKKSNVLWAFNVSTIHISLNNSTNTNHRHTLLTETYFCNSKLSKNIQFKKGIHLFFSILRKTCKKIKVPRLYFGRIDTISFKYSFTTFQRNSSSEEF